MLSSHFLELVFGLFHEGHIFAHLGSFHFLLEFIHLRLHVLHLYRHYLPHHVRVTSLSNIVQIQTLQKYRYHDDRKRQPSLVVVRQGEKGLPRELVEGVVEVAGGDHG